VTVRNRALLVLAVSGILGFRVGIVGFPTWPEGRRLSQVPHHLNIQIWERYSTQQWRELRRTYNVSQVVTRSDYLLHLPIAAETDGLRLYRIPD
jgi:hypothetical protein